MEFTEKNDERPIVAAFDFDGTISYHDTLFHFFLYCVGTLKAFWYFFLKLPVLVSYVFGRSTRQETKESILKKFFEGLPIHQVRQLGAAFAKDILPKHMRPEALKRIQWHLDQGHQCILVSASIDVYLEPWAKMVGFDHTLTSQLAFDTEGKVTGNLIGLNCRRQEKVRRLKELLGPLEGYCIYAYGDSKGDKELLEAADYPFYRKMS